ncbi:GTP 3',8-cyclase MoaA [Petroclostridium xylanilyticum]|jgi:cyclic pyranopterin phosphate synthase|uniref:GTP 3',8-cyclase MoaA n=1 Tax=Petroclostridium xylanilyticum TaxID=1792311 RepID=UPI0018E3DD4A|nr:GTP 3',8-cyclase MoaA [Petroclostridium xylanilyticum]
MKDRFGRKIEYLRISVTQNCNLRCIYCTSGSSNYTDNCCTGLTPREIMIIVKAMANIGIKKVRITGGEPLTRSDICEIISGISSITGIEDLSITTNGIYLYKMAEELKEAGLKRVNISLDSLRYDRFQYITGGGRLEHVLTGISRILELGMRPVKINTVLVKGLNDDEVDDFIMFTKYNSVDVRFIELMPIGKFGEQNTDKIVFNSDIIKAHPDLIRCESYDKAEVATYYQKAGYRGRVGFISPMSHKFCCNCNRIRLTYDGKIKPCLGDNGEVNVLDVLRGSPQKLGKFIECAVYEKPAGHNFQDGYSSVRKMNLIGG